MCVYIYCSSVGPGNKFYKMYGTHIKILDYAIIPISQLIALNFIIHTLKQYKML